MKIESADDIAVIVVWEPVIWSDGPPPITRVLHLISDGRATQFWDEGKLFSKAIVKAALARPKNWRPPDEEGELDEIQEDTIIWDFVAFYPAGVRWEGDVPPPEFFGYPVVNDADQVLRMLRSPVAHDPSNAPRTGDTSAIDRTRSN